MQSSMVIKGEDGYAGLGGMLRFRAAADSQAPETWAVYSDEKWAGIPGLALGRFFNLASAERFVERELLRAA